MKNTKDIKDFYENTIVENIENTLKEIEDFGFSKDTYATLRRLEDRLSDMNSAAHFVGAWNKGE